MEVLLLVLIYAIGGITGNLFCCYAERKKISRDNTGNICYMLGMLVGILSMCL